ncbi:MAG: hypothetical protein E7564_01935 [Ruminococcaceae bacterium]|nr:hypothetical protein [Oscillospiraceae bacterium]
MEFEEETVEFEVETVETVETTFETEEVEFEAPALEFEEDTVDFEDFSEELETEVPDDMFEEDTVTENFDEELEAETDIDTDEEYDYLSEEDRALVNEMNESGEMDYKPSDLGDAYTWHDGETLENAIEIDMPYNPDASYDNEEFIGQAQMQEDGLNQMTVAEYLDNYENYRENGRSPEGTQMQEQYRDGLVVSNAYDMMEADPSLSAEEAERLAAEELRGGAALHNPDQVAGGDPTEIHAYGSGSANSALGSMWGHGRADDMYEQIKEQTKGMTREEMENTHLNVHFNIHEKGK